MMPTGQPRDALSGKDDPKTTLYKTLEETLMILAGQLTDVYVDDNNIEYKYKDMKEALTGLYFMSMQLAGQVAAQDDIKDLDSLLSDTKFLLDLKPTNTAQYRLCINTAHDLYKRWCKIITSNIIKG